MARKARTVKAAKSVKPAKPAKTAKAAKASTAASKRKSPKRTSSKRPAAAVASAHKSSARPKAAASGSAKPATAAATARKRRRARKRTPPSFLLGTGPAVAFTDHDYDRARKALMRLDPRLAPIIKQAGKLRFGYLQDGDLFPALVETIISQQLSIRVADVIYERLCKLTPPPTSTLASTNGDGDAAAASKRRHTTSAAALRDMDLALMRTAGLSEAKARSIQDLAIKVCDGTLDLHGMSHLPDDEVVRQLCLVKGIGPWSAHIFLIFRLNRPDIWPIGDLGIVRALQRLNGWKKPPSLARLEKAGDIYRPYRSVAAWYLWSSLSQTQSATTT